MGLALGYNCMSKPLGDPPTTAELQQLVDSFFQKHSYGPFSCTIVSESHLIFTSKTYEVKFELHIEGDFDTIRYDVYRTDTGELLNSGRSHCDIAFNPSLTWDKHISRMLMSISGSINGDRDKLTRKD